MTSPRTVRSRLRAAIVGTVALALLLLGVPLGAATASLYRDGAENRLDGEAARVLASVPDDAMAAGIVLPPPRGPHAQVGLYNAAGTRVGGQGPQRDAVAARASREALEARAVVGGQVVVAVPFRRDRGGTVVVRAASPYDEVLRRTYRAWGVMLLLAALVLAVAFLVGSRRARTLAAPFEQLTADAQALGRGDFAVRAHVTGVSEADAASAALEGTARRLGAVLERERSYSADASHQLRTPLTRLRLGLESALLDPSADREEALRDAVVRLDGLQDTVTSLLALARDMGTTGGRCDPASAAAEAVARWRAAAAEAGRPLELGLDPDLPDVACSAGALHHVLDVLVDNALRHGAGAVRVGVRGQGPVIALGVADEGSGLDGDPERAFRRRSSDAGGTGIGLALARSLAEAEGGRLVVTSPGPQPVLTLLLPVAG